MKKMMLLLLVLGLGLEFSQAFAADDNALEKEDAAAQSVQNRPEWTQALKDKYSLTDEQIQTMKTSGVTFPQMAMVAGLSQASGKTIDEVLKMRTEQKMGWGQIAKSLGVKPGEIGRSVAGLRHQIREGKREAHAERKANRQAARAERHAEKMEKRQMRMDKMDKKDKTN